MKVTHYTISLETKKQFQLVNITEHIKEYVSGSSLKNGTLTVFCPHTTASVRLTHDEPLLMQDLLKTLYRLVPIDSSYSHDLFELRQAVAPNERSNGHAHVKSFLLGSSESLIVKDGHLLLGQKQSVFFIELDGGRQRSVELALIGT